AWGQLQPVGVPERADGGLAAPELARPTSDCSPSQVADGGTTGSTDGPGGATRSDPMRARRQVRNPTRPSLRADPRGLRQQSLQYLASTPHSPDSPTGDKCTQENKIADRHPSCTRNESSI